MKNHFADARMWDLHSEHIPYEVMIVDREWTVKLLTNYITSRKYILICVLQKLTTILVDGKQ